MSLYLWITHLYVKMTESSMSPIGILKGKDMELRQVGDS